MNLSREWRLFRRASIFWISIALTLCCLSLGSWNGVQRWRQQQADANNLNRQLKELLQTNRDRLAYIDDALNSGHADRIAKSEYDWGPRQTLWADSHDPPTSVLPPAPLGFLATGRTDVLPSSYASSAWRGLEPNAPTTDDPLRLLAGDFDLKFVILDLLPLLILLLCFDLAATEREDGTLRLILAQPVSFRTLLLSRTVVRTMPVLTGVVLAVAAAAIAAFASGDRFSLVLLGLYVFSALVSLVVWAALALVVNTLNRSATANALVLGTFWLIFAALLPGAMPVVAEVIYPTPSRALYVDAARAARLEIYNGSPDDVATQQQQSALLQGFLDRHPQWANRPELSRSNLLAAARGERHTEYLQQITSRFDRAYRRQRRAASFLNAVSPVLLQEELLTNLSGNSSYVHDDFLSQSLCFFDFSKAYFWPRIFRMEVFTPERFAEVPLFHYNTPSTGFMLRPCLLPCSLFAVWLIALLLIAVRRLHRRPEL